MSIMGFIALVLALAASIYSIFLFIYAERRKNERLMENARNGVLAVFGLMTLAVAILLVALFTHNFSIAYVADFSSTDTAPVYLISALWAGSSGSLLFWAWCLSVFAVIVIARRDTRVNTLVPQASVILAGIEIFFIVLLVFVNNPFRESLPAPADGAGLKTQLETVGMVFHPPLLLAGFAACAVPFAFGVAALLKRQFDSGWAISVRRWVLAAWLLLGAGNLIGAWWAYAELGWGGYWAWDPVENAGLMPWLVVTAFAHTINTQAKKGIFRAWTIALAMLAFTLTIFGTYLTRGDILSSVHTFNQAGISPFFMVFLFIIIAGSIALLVYRRKDMRDEQWADDLLSAEGTVLLTDILLLGATFIIFIGTIFPLISQTIGGANISLDQGFFNLAGLPFLLAVVLMAGVCTLIGWRKPSPGSLRAGLLWSSVPAVLALVIMLVFIGPEWHAALPVAICVFTLSAIIFIWQIDIRPHRAAKTPGNSRGPGIRWRWKHHANKIIHLGIAIMVIGIISSSVYDSQTEATLLPGKSVAFGAYSITYDQPRYSATASKMTLTADLSIFKNSKLIGTLAPSASIKGNDQSATSKVAIRSTLFEDLYIMPVDWEQITLADNSTSIQVSITIKLNPLVVWVWIGGAIVLLGGLISFWPSMRLFAYPGEAEK